MKNCDEIQLAALEGALDAVDLQHAEACAECKPIINMVEAMQDCDLKIEPSIESDRFVKEYAYSHRPSRSWKRIVAVVTAMAAALVCGFILLNDSGDLNEGSSVAQVSQASIEKVKLETFSELDGLDQLSSEELFAELEMELMVSTDMIMDADNDLSSVFR
jgi:hypothetical protein